MEKSMSWSPRKIERNIVIIRSREILKRNTCSHSFSAVKLVGNWEISLISLHVL